MSSLTLPPDVARVAVAILVIVASAIAGWAYGALMVKLLAHRRLLPRSAGVLLAVTLAFWLQAQQSAMDRRTQPESTCDGVVTSGRTHVLEDTVTHEHANGRVARIEHLHASIRLEESEHDAARLLVELQEIGLPALLTRPLHAAPMPPARESLSSEFRCRPQRGQYGSHAEQQIPNVHLRPLSLCGPSPRAG